MLHSGIHLQEIFTLHFSVVLHVIEFDQRRFYKGNYDRETYDDTYPPTYAKINSKKITYKI